MRIILRPIRSLLITQFNRKLIITHAPLHGCDAAARQDPNCWTFVGFAILKKATQEEKGENAVFHRPVTPPNMSIKKSNFLHLVCI